MKLSLSLWTAVATLVAGAYASNVVELTPDNFDSIIGQGKPALVEFFAPWCGHCKSLAPVYEKLADAYAHAKDKVVIAKVDADGVGKPLGNKYGVTGYPTLKWFDGKGEPTPYEAGRELEDFTAYITQKTGAKSNIRPPPPPEAKILDVHSFDAVALDESKNVLVSFTAPWCGHCKRMKDAYEQVARAFKTETDCVVANVDADAQLNKDLAHKYGVSSFPTIKFFPKGDKSSPIAYESGRDLPSFLAFLNEHCGTKRTSTGGLQPDAGRLAAFDALAQRFFAASGAARDAVVAEARSLGDVAGATAKYYLKALEKVAGGAEEYIEKELTRLEKITAKGTLSREKLDEIQLKANVLAALAAEKAGDVAAAVEEKAEEVIAKAKEEL